MILEGIPEFLVLSTTMTHWHAKFETAAMDLHCTCTNLCLSLWYLNFFSNPAMKVAVLLKLTVESLNLLGKFYGDYVDKYVNAEGEDCSEETIQSGKCSNYDDTNLINAVFIQPLYLILCPFIGLKEIIIAQKNSFVRDFDKSTKSQ